jgi:ribosomal protein L11 methyltransferase
VRSWPALDVVCPGDVDLLIALIDDYSPTALESFDTTTRVFFSSPAHRDAAQLALTRAGYVTTAVELPDDDWAKRSQANLTAVTVGRVTVAPPWEAMPSTISHSISHSINHSISHQRSAITLIIQPSLGFGTGHHATTRLCLAALQRVDLTGRSILDVGTGSGVLAIAANLLGARRSVGIDVDDDALQAARENLSLNPAAHRVELRRADIERDRIESSDVVVANLTAAVIGRAAPALTRATARGGTLIVSGLLTDEHRAVADALQDFRLTDTSEEDGWIVMVFALDPS